MIYLPIGEAAVVLKVSSWWLRKRVEDGSLPVLYLGKRALLDIDAIRPMIDELKKPGRVGLAGIIKATGLPQGSIRHGIKDGWIPVCKENGRYRFDVDEVKEALKQRELACQAKKRETKRG